MYIGNMGHWIAWWSKVDPKKEAVVFQNERVTYKELNENINRVCHILTSQLGVKKGDRVACLLNNCIEYYNIVMACAKVGARFVPINIRLAGREIEYIANNSEAKIIFLERGFEKVLEPIKGQLVTESFIFIDDVEFDGLMNRSSTEEPSDQACWDDDFGILYTSGTTGKPKGAVLTQENIMGCTNSTITAFGYTNSVKFLVFLPLCFTGALIPFSMPVFHTGGTIVLEKEFEPQRTLQLVEEEKITHLFGVPTVFKFIADLPEFENADLSSIRLISSGGGPVPIPLMKIYQERGIPFTGGYGLTEGGGFNMFLPPDQVTKRYGAYIPMMWSEIDLVDISGEPVPPGEVGEIIIKGSLIMREFWKQPEATAETIKEGWLSTGDMARRDEEGFFYIVDRKKDMIVSGGLNVYPAEVEDVICAHPAILDAAVIGLPHDIWGEAVAAVIMTRAGMEVEESDLIEFCKENLADYKSPKAIIRVDEMPLTFSGKILKRKLREQYKSHFNPSD